MWNGQVDSGDRAVLRHLAQRVAEIAASDENNARWELWRRHNSLERVRPLVRVSPEGAWIEILPPDALACFSELARYFERDFRQRIYYAECLKDDTYISDMVYVPLSLINTKWGVASKQAHTDQGDGSFAYEPFLKSPEDWKQMIRPTVKIDTNEDNRRIDMIEDLVGDLLHVRPSLNVPWDLHLDTYLVDTLVALRGNQRFLEDMYDRPEWVHEVMSFMTESIVRLLEDTERDMPLILNNGPDGDGTGSLHVTDELPGPGFDGRVRFRDLWGDSNAQEFFGVSPEMHYEFGLKYQIRILERFGLTSYGCCEPLDRKLDYVKMIPNLRRVSISPWADVTRAAEGLQGDYVFSWKPNPAYVAGDSFNSRQIRDDIRRTVRVAREHGCVLEMILKDTHTVRNRPERLTQWVRIALEEVESVVEEVKCGELSPQWGLPTCIN